MGLGDVCLTCLQSDRWHQSLSGRQLQRRFASPVGYGPKTFHSILRFQRVLYLASGETTDKTPADLAFEAGYADQQ